MIGPRLGNLGRAPVPEWEEVARAGGEPASPMPPAVTGPVVRAYPLLLVAGMVCLVVGAVFGWAWLGVAGWLIAAVTDWLATRSDGPVTRLLDLIGLRPSVRALLRSLLALVAIGSAARWLVVGYLLVVLALQLDWLLRTVLATWVARNAPPLVYQPGASPQPGLFGAHARCYGRAVGTPGSFVAIEAVALGGVLVPGGTAPLASVPVLAAVLAVVAALALRDAIQARRLLASRTADEASVLAAAAAGTPAYLVYVSLAAGQARYIVNQWVPVLDAVEVPGLLVVREASQLCPIRPTRLPVVYAPMSRHVERLVVPSVRAAFYLAYGEKNGTLMRDASIRHVMLMHGDSDKSTSANPLARGFDEVWVAGQAGIDRYAAAGIDIPPHRFAIVGRPQVEPLAVGPRRRRPLTVLYAPTFEGYYDHTSHSSLDTMGPAIVRRLLSDFPDVAVWFKPHPASGVQRPSMLAAIDEINLLLRAPSAAGHVVVDDRPALTLVDCLQSADVLITDISSVATDFLHTERPVVTTNPAGLDLAEFHARYPSQRGCYILGPTLEGFAEIIADALGGDSLRAERLATKRYVLGDCPDGPQRAFAAQVARITAD